MTIQIREMRREDVETCGHIAKSMTLMSMGEYNEPRVRIYLQLVIKAGGNCH